VYRMFKSQEKEREMKAEWREKRKNAAQILSMGRKEMCGEGELRMGVWTTG
jgi:hypothetical protein